MHIFIYGTSEGYNTMDISASLNHLQTFIFSVFLFSFLSLKCYYLYLGRWYALLLNWLGYFVTKYSFKIGLNIYIQRWHKTPRVKKNEQKIYRIDSKKKMNSLNVPKTDWTKGTYNQVYLPRYERQKGRLH